MSAEYSKKGIEVVTKKILIVDDDATTRAILCGGLRAGGYETLEADSGLPVMQIIREHAPALIITDIIMDGQEGFETIGQIRQEYESLPIIAISSKPEYLVLTPDLGANVILTKPIDVPLLLNKVTNLISN